MDEDDAISYSIDEEERPSIAIVRAVAEITGTPVLQMDPLYGVVDPDHLDTVIDGARADESGLDASFDFHYEGCEVSLDGDHLEVRVIDAQDG